jgi:hypothetical protein
MTEYTVTGIGEKETNYFVLSTTRVSRITSPKHGKKKNKDQTRSNVNSGNDIMDDARRITSWPTH